MSPSCRYHVCRLGEHLQQQRDMKQIMPFPLRVKMTKPLVELEMEGIPPVISLMQVQCFWCCSCCAVWVQCLCFHMA